MSAPTDADADTGRAQGLILVATLVGALVGGVLMGNAMANDPAGENFSGGGFFVGAAAAVIFSLPAWGLYSLGAKILKNVLALRAELAAASTGA